MKERQKNTKKLVLRDEQPTPEEQLARLEEDIRRLKVEFDIYFNGAAKRPPYDTKGRVEAKRSCGEQTDDLGFARFHRMVAEKSEALKERAGCERVHFSVAVRDGRVQFKAKAEK